jgi:DHA1 family solute carrier family 18 vesicular amine transporter 1/2
MSRRFWLSSGVIFLDETIYLAIVPLLPTFAALFDLTRLDVAILVAAYPLFMLGASLPGGLLADRLGPRRLLIVGSALLAVASLGFAYAESEWQLWAARAVQGLTSGLTSTAGMAVIADAAVPTLRATLIGLATSVQGMSTLAGPVLGGFLAPAIGIREAFLVPAGLAAVVLIGIALPGWDDMRPQERMTWRNAIGSSLSQRVVKGAVAAVLAVGLVQGAIQTLVPLALGEEGYSASALGTLFLVGSVLGLLLAPAAGRFADVFGVARVTTLAFLLVPPLVLALAVAPAAWVLAALLVLLVPLLRTGASLAFALGAEHAPLGRGLATGYGLVLSAWSLGAVAGPLIAGAIADAAGDAFGFAATAGLAALLVGGVAAAGRPQPARYVG